MEYRIPSRCGRLCLCFVHAGISLCFCFCLCASTGGEFEIIDEIPRLTFRSLGHRRSMLRRAWPPRSGSRKNDHHSFSLSGLCRVDPLKEVFQFFLSSPPKHTPLPPKRERFFFVHAHHGSGRRKTTALCLTSFSDTLLSKPPNKGMRVKKTGKKKSSTTGANISRLSPQHN